MKERGRYQIQCMKSRSSTGVGMKVDLEYNIETMRITDPGEDASPGTNHPESIMNKIKATAKPANTADADADDTAPIRADANGSKLKSMLAGIKAKSV